MLDCSLEGIYEDTECLSWVFLHNINPLLLSVGSMKSVMGRELPQSWKEPVDDFIAPEEKILFKFYYNTILMLKVE